MNTRFEGLSNYSDLADQGATRDNMAISPAGLNNAVLALHYGFTPNAPQLTGSEAADCTAEKYLAGMDGWNPAW
ncbi:hypothetical protein [Streptomyces sp. NPDC051572]|uniref:hypothetical protein n=1 Tax=unclassified Streptomyces TaxID=2593676 RepID=UPI00344EA987